MTDGDWRDGGFRQRRPSAETLAWVAASMARGSRIVGYRRLTGGVSSAMHGLTVERRGTRTFVVLRQYPAGLGLQGALEREIANLGLVAGSGLPVPRILATDVAGASTGGSPSLLMTRLPGHVDLSPAEPRLWMTRIAELAVLLHSLELLAKPFRPWTDSWIAPLEGLQAPVGAQNPAVWKAAFAVMAEPPPKDTDVFLHGDFLPVNMLWTRGRITGLTDWNGVHRGSRAIDIGQCRRYRAAIYSPEWSEQLRSLYESIAGVTLDPWWDLYALLHHNDDQQKWIPGQVAGRRPVDVGRHDFPGRGRCRDSAPAPPMTGFPCWSLFPEYWHAHIASDTATMCRQCRFTCPVIDPLRTSRVFEPMVWPDLDQLVSMRKPLVDSGVWELSFVRSLWAATFIWAGNCRNDRRR